MPIATGIKNFIGFPGTHQTKDQEEWMRNTILNKIRSTGSLEGGIHYGDYAAPANTTGIGVSQIPYNSHASTWDGGLFGPARAYGTTLGLGDYSVPQQGGKVDWTGGTSYDFHPSDFQNNRVLKSIANIVNKGGLLGKGTPQHYIPNITITPQDIMNIFGGGQMVHKGEPTITAPTINRPTSAQTNQSSAMDSQLTQSQAGNRQTPTSVSPTTVNIPKPSTTRRARGTRGRSAPVVRQPNLFSNQRIGGRYGL